MKLSASILLFISQLVAPPFARSQDTLVWPQAPDRPRVRHLSTISSRASFHQDQGVFSKIIRFFTGGEQSTPWLVQPVGVAVSPDGIIFVADPGANGVHRIDEKEREHVLFGETRFGSFRSPVGVACGADGRVYVSDSDAGRVVIADRNLEGKAVITDHLERPTGISIIREELYVVDSKKHAVVIFDLDGKFLGEFGHRGVGDGEFNYPVQIAGTDSLYVVDALNYRLQEFDHHGAYRRKFGQQGNALGRFASPKAVAVDSDGNLYVTDALLDNVQIFSPAGQLLLAVGSRGVKDGEFMMPNGIAIDSRDRVYVVDTMNRRLQVFQYLK